MESELIIRFSDPNDSLDVEIINLKHLHMKHVVFEPWIGNEYQTGGIFKKKILVIGESFYCSEEEAEKYAATLTKKVVEDYLAIRNGELRENDKIDAATI